MPQLATPDEIIRVRLWAMSAAVNGRNVDDVDAALKVALVAAVLSDAVLEGLMNPATAVEPDKQAPGAVLNSPPVSSEFLNALLDDVRAAVIRGVVTPDEKITPARAEPHVTHQAPSAAENPGLDWDEVPGPFFQLLGRIRSKFAADARRLFGMRSNFSDRGRRPAHPTALQSLEDRFPSKPLTEPGEPTPLPGSRSAS